MQYSPNWLEEILDEVEIFEKSMRILDLYSDSGLNQAVKLFEKLSVPAKTLVINQRANERKTGWGFPKKVKDLFKPMPIYTSTW